MKTTSKLLKENEEELKFYREKEKEFNVGFGTENRNKLEMIKRIMAIYKKEIGHNWEAIFAATVRIDLP